MHNAPLCLFVNTVQDERGSYYLQLKLALQYYVLVLMHFIASTVPVWHHVH